MHLVMCCVFFSNIHIFETKLYFLYFFLFSGGNLWYFLYLTEKSCKIYTRRRDLCVYCLSMWALVWFRCYTHTHTGCDWRSLIFMMCAVHYTHLLYCKFFLFSCFCDQSVFIQANVLARNTGWKRVFVECKHYSLFTTIYVITSVLIVNLLYREYDSAFIVESCPVQCINYKLVFAVTRA